MHKIGILSIFFTHGCICNHNQPDVGGFQYGSTSQNGAQTRPEAVPEDSIKNSQEKPEGEALERWLPNLKERE